MNLKDVRPGTVVQLDCGCIVVTSALGDRKHRYVMQESGVPLRTASNQEVEVFGVAWAADLAAVLIAHVKKSLQR